MLSCLVIFSKTNTIDRDAEFRVRNLHNLIFGAEKLYRSQFKPNGLLSPLSMKPPAKPYPILLYKMQYLDNQNIVLSNIQTNTGSILESAQSYPLQILLLPCLAPSSSLRKGFLNVVFFWGSFCPSAGRRPTRT